MMDPALRERARIRAAVEALAAREVERQYRAEGGLGISGSDLEWTRAAAKSEAFSEVLAILGSA